MAAFGKYLLGIVVVLCGTWLTLRTGGPAYFLGALVVAGLLVVSLLLTDSFTLEE